MFVYVGHQCPDHITAAEVEECDSKDCPSNKLQARRRALGIGNSSGKSCLKCPVCYTPKLVVEDDGKLILTPQWLCLFFHTLRVPEQALGGTFVGFGIVVKDKPSEFQCNKNSLLTGVMYMYIVGDFSRNFSEDSSCSSRL